MTKLLLIVGGIVFLIIGGSLYIRFFAPSNPLQTPLSNESSLDSKLTKDLEASTGTEQQRITNLETAVITLGKQIAALNVNLNQQKSSSNSGDLKTLQATVTDLQNQINILKGTNTTATTTSGTKSPLYIPLGWSGSSQATDWTSISSQTITIDPSDYGGYTSMQFEANLLTYQGSGRAYARIFNKDDGLSIAPSELSSTSQDYTWVSSSTFKLTATSKKTYVLQLKSLNGYAAQIENARIKVNF